jgi:GTPase SAR1 family protein
VFDSTSVKPYLTAHTQYSIVAESTFFETKEIREQILDTKDPVVPPVVLVGNKLDLADERTVKREQGESQVCNCYIVVLFVVVRCCFNDFDCVLQAKEWNCPYLECSAKANENIEQIFQKCVQLHLGDKPDK